MHGGGSHWLFSSIFILPTSAILNEAGRVSPTRATIQSTQGFAAPPSSSSSDMLCVGGRLAHPLQCKPAVSSLTSGRTGRGADVVGVRV